MATVPVVIGAGLIGLALFDVYVTTIAAAAGGGPFTRGLSVAIARLATGLPHRDIHRRLQRSGHVVLVAVVIGWLVLIWGGFVLLFLSDPSSVMNSTTTQNAGIVAKLAYAAGALAGAGAGYVATSGGWEFVNNAAALIGLSWAALTLTYLFQVVTAASKRRALAIRILGVADDPVAMAAAGAGEPDLGLLGQHLTTLAEEVALVARYHHALPVLPYFHTVERHAAIEVAVAVVDEALTILHARDGGVPTAAVGPMRAAIGELLGSVRLTEEHRDPPLPATERLDAEGVTVDPAELRAHADELSTRRRRLRALVEDRGWDWSADVLRTPPKLGPPERSETRG
ncbi:MAG: hypothetical protein KY469_19335 [Actinobacteria bacterium]|nr:hypothetical protein [Actinomycetota bacterium]